MYSGGQPSEYKGYPPVPHPQPVQVTHIVDPPPPYNVVVPTASAPGAQYPLQASPNHAYTQTPTHVQQGMVYAQPIPPQAQHKRRSGVGHLLARILRGNHHQHNHHHHRHHFRHHGHHDGCGCSHCHPTHHGQH